MNEAQKFTHALTTMADESKGEERTALLCSIFKWTLIHKTGKLDGDNPTTCALCCRSNDYCGGCPVEDYLVHQGTTRMNKTACYDTPFGQYSDSAESDSKVGTTASPATTEAAAAELAFLIRVFEHATGETFAESMLDPFHARFNELIK